MNSFQLTDRTKEIIEDIKRINALSYEDLSNEFQKAIDLSRKLGENGWTVDGSKTPNDIREWLFKIESNGEEAIAQLFSENEIENIFDRAETRYNSLPEQGYIWRAIENYHAGRYTEAAMFLLGVIDSRISQITPEKYRKKTKQCQEGIVEQGKVKFDDNSNCPAFRQLVICYYIPSFSAFAERLFVDNEKYNLSNGIEPPYLNRNWLFHGRMCRRVKRFECIQLIHSFATLAEIEDWITEDTNNG